ncbi:MAG TPA: hypothetical protein PKA78_02410 [Macellibacteroides fermentans]|uniref:hypothetical protein n=1 Tax=Macellibacteroides fermentans TaxID=879969 RepID=UPI002BD80828|nr:hypothetical protein [Macellibacteroides fermentans]
MNKIGELVGRPLTKEHLNSEIFLQLSNSDFKYISNESKELLENYSTATDTKIGKELWINLLIDSISILKINDKREKLYDDSSKSEDFAADFSKIRKSSTYGINEIASYFDEFIKFESVLYGTDEHYRDHVDHVLQVWGIGIGLLLKNKFKLADNCCLSDTNFHFEIPEANKKESIDGKNNETQNVSKSEYYAMWTIIALCHDLGYPIEKTSQINKQAKKIISHFGNMNFSELNYSFDIFNTFLVDKFLNVISSKAVFSEELNYTMIQTKYRDKFSKSLEDYKHGIFSSLLLYKNLTYFLETDFFVSKSSLDPEDLRQFLIRKEILRSISSHTCPKIYHIDLNTLSFLLILCDELQEWNRPKFSELSFSKLTSKEPTVQIKQFDMDDDNQKIWLCFKYDLLLTINEKKYLINDRFKNIHCLLRSAKGDSNRNTFFKWEIEDKDGKFTFCFDSMQNSFKQLRVYYQKLNGKRFDIEIDYELYKDYYEK